MIRGAQRGFTLVEVLVAAFVLSLLATGAIATTWRLAGFARQRASELAAESYCADVAMSYLSQDLAKLVDQTKPIFEKTFIASDATKKTGLKLPRFVGKDFFGETVDVIPFWREGYEAPKLEVWVTNGVSRSASVGVRVVSVSLKWGVKSDLTTSTFSLEQGE